MITLHTVTNTYDDGYNYHQFLQVGDQPLLASLATGASSSLEDFLREDIIGDCETTDDRQTRLLEATLKSGDVAKLLRYAERCHVRANPGRDHVSQTRFGEWELDSVVIQEATLRESQEDVWASDPLFVRAEWKGEVARNETHLGYWEWVEHQREADVTPMVIRNTADGSFWDNEDGWTDFASATRFTRADCYKLSLPLFDAEWVTEEEALPWKVGDEVVWTDPDNGICTRTGVLAFIAIIGPGHLAVSMEDGWEADVMVTELSHEDE